MKYVLLRFLHNDDHDVHDDRDVRVDRGVRDDHVL